MNVLERERLLADTVGKEIIVSFGAGWDNYAITLVFRANLVKKDVLLSGSGTHTVVIPWEVMEKEISSLQIGAEGVDAEGRVFRSDWGDLGRIWPSAHKAGEISEEQSKSVYDQALSVLAETQAVAESVRSAAELGEFDGTDGKSAYAYAQDGGYTGTEAEFAAKLAEETPGIHIGAEAPTDDSVLWVDTDEEANEESAEAVPSDWNAAEGEPGHVLNRTHYKKTEAIVSETTVEPDEEGSGSFTPVFDVVVGQKYKVTVDGVENEYTAILQDGIPLILSEDGGFMIAPGEYIGFEGAMGILGLTTPFTISISQVEYEPLPEAYLPAHTEVYTVVVPEGEIDTSTTVWTLSESGDKAAETLYNGGRVWLDITTSEVIGNVINVRCELVQYAISYVESSGETLLTGSVLYDKNVVSVLFATGVWTPPTA